MPPNDESWAGTGIFEAYHSTITSIGDDSASEADYVLGVAFDSIGALSATVMAVIDPLAALFAAGVGWLLEHISFLREPLDYLLGDKDAIQANVDATSKLAAEIRVLAEDHRKGLGTTDGWSGQSSEKFTASMDKMGQELDALAEAVNTKAKVVAVTGTLVIILRDIIRDAIAQFVGSLISGAIQALAWVGPSVGASIPIFIGKTVAQAVALGAKIAAKVGKLISALGRNSARIGKLSDIMSKVGKGWERFENVADVAEVAYESKKAADKVDQDAEAARTAGAPAPKQPTDPLRHAKDIDDRINVTDAFGGGAFGGGAGDGNGSHVDSTTAST
jgi:uncharacterized protein YukE